MLVYDALKVEDHLLNEIHATVEGDIPVHKIMDYHSEVDKIVFAKVHIRQCRVCEWC